METVEKYIKWEVGEGERKELGIEREGSDKRWRSVGTYGVIEGVKWYCNE